VREAFIARQPIRRLGTTQEVAALAVFLGSDESSFITGQPHLIDGGMALWRPTGPQVVACRGWKSLWFAICSIECRFVADRS
jgi:hypothetical protein